jgi:hypothetical protein
LVATAADLVELQEESTGLVSPRRASLDGQRHVGERPSRERQGLPRQRGHTWTSGQRREHSPRRVGAVGAPPTQVGGIRRPVLRLTLDVFLSLGFCRGEPHRETTNSPLRGPRYGPVHRQGVAAARGQPGQRRDEGKDAALGRHDGDVDRPFGTNQRDRLARHRWR